DIAMAAITVAELLLGVDLVAAARRRARARFVERIVESVPIEDYDLDVARVHAGLLAHTRRSGQPRGAHDLIIAATAVATQREVLTRDQRGFEDLPGVVVVYG